MERSGKFKSWTTQLREEIFAISLAQKDPRTPWYTKALAVCVVGYAFTPIDLIPDFIPVLGLLDDLVLIPLGVAVVAKLIPAEVLNECRQKAATDLREAGRRSWFFGGAIIIGWIVVGLTLAICMKRVITG